jgi:hypothetical protein
VQNKNPHDSFYLSSRKWLENPISVYMNMTTTPKNQCEHAAAWILKSLSSNIAWFDEVRLAGRKNFEKKYHFIPLIDISLVCERYDINVLKDACYLLKHNEDVDIWGDDFEPFGMLVQISEKGLDSCRRSTYSRGQNFILKSLIALTPSYRKAVQVSSKTAAF